jgi:hypothetical protein
MGVAEVEAAADTGDDVEVRICFLVGFYAL